MKNIFYIHGINSTSLSFNYIWSKLPPHNIQYIEYGFKSVEEEIVDNVVNILSNYSDKTFSIVGHSMGGIIALLTQLRPNINIDKIVTIASPFNGCKIVSMLRRMYPQHADMFNKLKNDSDLIQQIQNIELFKPVLSIVGNYGNFPTLKEPNDGVVTLESQKSLTGPKYIEIPANHFELLLHDDTVSAIKTFLWR